MGRPAHRAVLIYPAMIGFAAPWACRVDVNSDGPRANPVDTPDSTGISPQHPREGGRVPFRMTNSITNHHG